MQGKDRERLRRADLAERIQEVVVRRDMSGLWTHLKRTEPTRTQFFHALRLVRAGIDLDAPDILLVTRSLT